MVAPDSLTDSSERNASKGDVVNGHHLQAHQQQPQPLGAEPTSNGNETLKTDVVNSKSTTEDEVTTKQPSYVALACCISGYTTLGYDSKQRQGLRSRPVSPIRGVSPIRTEDSTTEDGDYPKPVRANKFRTRMTDQGINKNASYSSECGNFLSPVARDLTPKMQAQEKGIEVLNGCGSLHSPIRHQQVSNMSVVSQESRTSYTSKSMFVSESFSSYSSNSTTTCYSTSSLHSSSTVNGSSVESRLITPTKLSTITHPEEHETSLSPSSFIVQRVERLYGPGALAQAFYKRRTSTSNVNTSFESTKDLKTSHSIDEISLAKTEESLPVFRLLRPEFRAQLSLANRKSRSISIDQPNERLKPTESEEEKSCDEADMATTKKTIRYINDASTPTQDEKDGRYFLKLLEEQVGLLESLANSAEEELKTCPNEEGCGVLRATAGKAKLLVAQKLNQFRGLCNNNIKQSSEEDFPTTNEDLAGFWDMVMIQVRDVINQFDEIKKLCANGWRMPKTKPNMVSNGCANGGPPGSVRKSVATKKLPAGGSAVGDPSKMSAASRARDEARKKMLEERRKAMRQNRQQHGNTEDLPTVIACKVPPATTAAVE